MRAEPVGPDRILALSTRQAFARIAFWIRANTWHLVTSLPIVTLPPSAAALHHVVRAGLLDPFETQTSVRTEYARGFRMHLWRSYGLAALNLAALAAIVLATVFWFTREPPWQYVTAVALAFFAFWWLCQPYLYAMLVEHPELPVPALVRATARQVVLSPGVALTTALAHSAIGLVTALLMGPSLLFTPSYAALIAVQSLWSMTGRAIPDLVQTSAEE